MVAMVELPTRDQLVEEAKEELRKLGGCMTTIAVINVFDRRGIDKTANNVLFWDTANKLVDSLPNTSFVPKSSGHRGGTGEYWYQRGSMA